MFGRLIYAFILSRSATFCVLRQLFRNHNDSHASKLPQISFDARKGNIRPTACDSYVSRMIRSKWPICLCRQAIVINISRILRNPHAFSASGQLSKNIELIPWRYSTGAIAKSELQTRKNMINCKCHFVWPIQRIAQTHTREQNISEKWRHIVVNSVHFIASKCFEIRWRFPHGLFAPSLIIIIIFVIRALCLPCLTARVSACLFTNYPYADLWICSNSFGWNESHVKR